jgi:hypothetical protein
MTPRPTLSCGLERGKMPEVLECVVSLIGQGLIGVRLKALDRTACRIAGRSRLA